MPPSRSPKPTEPEYQEPSQELAKDPHDALFELIFARLEDATVLLRALLPARLVRTVDWPTLLAVKGGGADRRLQKFLPDLVFTARLLDQECWLDILVEHKSKPVRFTGLQLLGYITRRWERFRSLHKFATKLPLVFGLVVYHGATKWSHGTDLRDLTDAADLDPQAKRDFLSLPFAVCDLTCKSSAVIRAMGLSPLGGLALFCLKRARHSHDLLGELREWLVELRAVISASPPTEAEFGLIEYILQVGRLKFSEILNFLKAEVGPEAEQLLKSTYDQILEKGHRAGKVEGKVEGKLEGKVEGQAELLAKQLEIRFGPLPHDVADQVQHATREQLERWATAVLTAATLEQVLAEK